MDEIELTEFTLPPQKIDEKQMKKTIKIKKDPKNSSLALKVASITRKTVSHVLQRTKLPYNLRLNPRDKKMHHEYILLE